VCCVPEFTVSMFLEWRYPRSPAALESTWNNAFQTLKPRVLAGKRRIRRARHCYAAMINWTCMACHAFIPLSRCEIVLPEEARAHES
jgi:hypothetical protein